jgi:hypothetical protein
LTGGDPGFEELVAKVVGFVEAPSLGLDLLLDVRGTAFRQRVWQALREVPAGSTASYADIAKRIGAPKSVRAVARACAANAIAVANSLPLCRAEQWCALRLPLGRRAQVRVARTGHCNVNIQTNFPSSFVAFARSDVALPPAFRCA